MSNAKAEIVQNTIETAAKDAQAMLKNIGIGPEIFARVALNAALLNPEILNCDPRSLRHTILVCAQRGLLPDGDSAAIVPKGGKAALIIGYKGMADLARRAIKGIVLKTGAVTGDDAKDGIWEHEEGLTPILRHKRAPTGARATEQNVIASYAIAWMPGNTVPEYVVLYRSDLDWIRKTYTSDKSTAWAKEYAAQAKKTALRQLLKLLPVRSGLMTISESDPLVHGDDPIEDIDADPADETQQPEQPRDQAQAAQQPAQQTRRGRTSAASTSAARTAPPAAAPPPPPPPNPPPPPAAQETDHGHGPDPGDFDF